MRPSPAPVSVTFLENAHGDWVLRDHNVGSREERSNRRERRMNLSFKAWRVLKSAIESATQLAEDVMIFVAAQFRN